jgi:hypothetical protein
MLSPENDQSNGVASKPFPLIVPVPSNTSALAFCVSIVTDAKSKRNPPTAHRGFDAPVKGEKRKLLNVTMFPGVMVLAKSPVTLVTNVGATKANVVVVAKLVPAARVPPKVMVLVSESGIARATFPDRQTTAVKRHTQNFFIKNDSF